MSHTVGERRLSVMMITEGTYPYHWGGVSTWCHLLLNDLSHIDFTLLSVVDDPGAVPQFTLPANVVEFRPMPLWGLRERIENKPDLGPLELHRRRSSTTEQIIADHFVPLFRSFLDDLFADTGDPYELGLLVHKMHRFFLERDFDTTMQSRVVWHCFVQAAQQGFPRAAAYHGYPGARFDLADLTDGMQWLYHWLFPIGAPLPKTDVAHAAMVGVCTLIAVAAKLEHGASFMLTEHGIYLRERYLAEARSAASLFRKVFSLRFARRMTELSYALADQISPCCDYNQRWELQNGATLEQLHTIYYGVDSKVFAPCRKPDGDPPVVVWVGRIDPLKDLFTLLRAAALVRQSRPDIQFRLYGSAPPGNEVYYEDCLTLHKELGLEDGAVFGGYRAKPVRAFNEGDVVVLSSISEAFPFVILEAMLCEKPVVATAVGGVPEQVEGCGIAVEPRNPEALAEAILDLMNDPELCAALGRRARQKALQEYSLRQSASAHEASYQRLVRHQTDQATPAPIEPSLAIGSHAHPAFGGSDAQSAAIVSQAVETSLLAGAYGAGSLTRRDNGTQAAVAELLVLDKRGNGDAERHGHGLDNDGPLALPDGLAELSATPAKEGSRRKVEKADQIARLAAEVAQRVVEPIDALEITALLESMGITDAVASNRYGAPDVFELGEAVLDHLRAHRQCMRLTEKASPPHQTRREALSDYARGPLALIPPLVILLLIAAFGLLGGWSQRQLWVLSTGLTGSMLLTNGFNQAISRRISIYLGLRKRDTARRFLWRSLAVGSAGMACIALLVTLVITALGIVLIDEGLLFGLSFLGLSALWLGAGSLSLVQKPGWLAAGLAVGSVVGVVVDRAVASFSGPHLALGTAVGFAVAIAVLVTGVRRAFADDRASHRSRSAPPICLPSFAYLVHESAPYFGYGTLYMVFVFVPHVLGWCGAMREGMKRMWVVNCVEMGLTLSMLPLILLGGVVEHALRLFWNRAPAAQAGTPAEDIVRFGLWAETYHRRRLHTYLLVFALVSVVAGSAFLVAFNAGYLAKWLDLPLLDQTVLIFGTGLVAYGLLGWGLFNCMFCVTLGHPQSALRAVTWGIVATTVVGLPLSTLAFNYSGIAFILGAAVFVVTASMALKDDLRSVDYHFVSSI